MVDEERLLQDSIKVICSLLDRELTEEELEEVKQEIADTTHEGHISVVNIAARFKVKENTCQE